MKAASTVSGNAANEENSESINQYEESVINNEIMTAAAEK